ADGGRVTSRPISPAPTPRARRTGHRQHPSSLFSPSPPATRITRNSLMANNDIPTPDEGSSDETIARPEDELLRDAPDPDEPDEVTVEPGADLDEDGYADGGYPEPPRPVNWRTLTAEDAEHEWLALNEWVNWLRAEF